MSDARAELLTTAVRHYPWGSRTVLPRLLGQPSPADEPWAEIWMGAHPLDPSYLPDGRSLARVAPGLPFMVKLLAAEAPLSIQAHPDLRQARSGFAAEQARNVPLSAPDRAYKDDNHKPELFVAIEPTQTLCGFRLPADIVATADRLDVDELSELVAPARGAADDALRTVFTGLLRRTGSQRADLVGSVLEACRRITAGADGSAASDRAGGAEGAGGAQGTDRIDAAEAERLRWVVRLGELYPDDAGALAPLLLELVVLEPGEGLFVAAGVLHAYLHGAGVEVQASSDNVLRGGLTGKHVDVDELLRVVRFEAAVGHRVLPEPVAPGLDAYDVPVADFEVWRLRPSDATVATILVGPAIAVCVEGVVQVSGVTLRPGQAAYVPSPIQIVVGGHGTCFVTVSG